AATRVGLAAIIGAFLAGLILSQAGKEHELEEKIQPIVSFLSPFFFVHVGTLVNFEALISPRGAALVAGLTVVAVAGKLLGSGLPALPLGRNPALIIGLGMVPRGEVGVIVASLGLSLGVIEEQLYAVVVAMAVLTTLLSPGLLSWALREPTSRKEAGNQDAT
ncbi:MAG: cation:proton antiporter, partial [Actinomycetota bacterium]